MIALVTPARLSGAIMPHARKTTVMAAAGTKTPRSTRSHRPPASSSAAAELALVTLLMMTP